MSGARRELDSDALLRQLAREDIPSPPDDAARRHRLIGAIGQAVRHSTEATRTAQRRRRWLGVLAAAAAILVVGLGLWMQLAPRSMEVASAGVEAVQGTVIVRQRGAERVVAATDQPLAVGDSLLTAARSHARLVTRKSRFDVAESTELSLARAADSEERIALRLGRVDVEVEKTVQPSRAVVVETPDAEVLVRGTVFDVRVAPSASGTATEVHVTRGSVWVFARGTQVAVLSAGQRWSSAERADDSQSPSGSRAAPPPSAAPEVVAAPSGAAPSGAAAESSSKERHAAPRVAPAGRVRSDSGTSRSGTLAAENRLFAAAVDARNRGDDAQALEILAQLLSEYPRTALREAARAERFRALGRLGQTSRAASEARRYLAEHGDGFARDEARRLALEPDEKK